jgi:nitrogen fixation protein NifB
MPDREKLRLHPCYDEDAHSKHARIHLPVAKDCNLTCRFCGRGLSRCGNYPGRAASVMTPEEAMAHLEEKLKIMQISVAGIAGPGEPLFNEATFETMALLHERHPEMVRCLSTNGLLLPDTIERLKRFGLDTITITVNALDPAVYGKIIDTISYKGERRSGENAMKVLIANQRRGAELAVAAGMAVKINTVYIPEFNAGEIENIARLYSGIGIYSMNIIPLIPLGKFGNLRTPTVAEMGHMRNACKPYVRQFRKCRQCRADACGIPGKETAPSIDGASGCGLGQEGRAR